MERCVTSAQLSGAIPATSRQSPVSAKDESPEEWEDISGCFAFGDLRQFLDGGCTIAGWSVDADWERPKNLQVHTSLADPPRRYHTAGLSHGSLTNLTNHDLLSLWKNCLAEIQIRRTGWNKVFLVQSSLMRARFRGSS